MLIEWIFWGGLGLIIGSFVNVLILRQGVAGLGGRSACPSCGTTLQWFELVPVLSWVLLRGTCRTCSARISVQYPLVELLTALGFLAIGLAPLEARPLTGLAPTLLILKIIGVAIVALLIAITVYDLYHTIIPNVWSYTFGALALGTSALLTLPDISAFAFFLAAGPAVALPLFLLWLYSRGSWMGLGDAKLALGIGWLLGILSGFAVLMLAFVIGAIVGMCILLPLGRIVGMLRKAGLVRGLASNGTGITRSRAAAAGFTMKSEIPFGPFLVCATALIWIPQLYGVDTTALLVDFLSLNYWW